MVDSHKARRGSPPFSRAVVEIFLPKASGCHIINIRRRTDLAAGVG
jgi:hypothetical protein